MNNFNVGTMSNKKTRSIKRKNMKLDLLLMNMFSFSYAGKCHVFIHTRYDKYELVTDKVHIVEDIFTFSPNYIARYKFDTLYQAILAFNKVVSIIVSSMDWFNPELFNGTVIYDEIFLKV